MPKYIAQRVFTIFWLIAFLLVLVFLLYKIQWYRDHADDALSWLIQSFAPVGAMIATVVLKDRKLPKNVVKSHWLFWLTLFLSVSYVMGLLAFIAYADSFSDPQAMVGFLHKAGDYFAAVQGAVVSALALFFKA